MKKIIAGTFITFILLSLAVLSLGYFGERTFTHQNPLPPADAIIARAKTLKGTPYDPLMGMYGNIGASLGFIVCSDVPNIAFGQEGYSWQEVLAEDFKQHPAAYNSGNGNNPDNPFFHRRARNLYSYFKANKRLKPVDSLPSAGDLVFYRKSEKGYIAHVALVTEVVGHEYNIMESAPKTLLAQEVDGNSPMGRGWIVAGFGRVYPSIPGN